MYFAMNFTVLLGNSKHNISDLHMCLIINTNSKYNAM